MQTIKQYGETIFKLSEFVKKLDETVRVEAFKFMLAREIGKPLANQEAEIVTNQRNSRARELAPQELIKKSGKSKLNEKAIVLAYWLEEFQQKPSFSSGDLKAAFEQAREQAPKNPSDIVAKLEGAARIMKAEKAGTIQHYRLTSSAIDEVEQWLNPEKGKNETK